MKRRPQISFLATLAMLAAAMLWVGMLHAQTTPGTEQPSSQAPGQAPSTQPGQTAPGQAAPGQAAPGQAAPDAQAQPTDPNGVQTFTGTVAQQGGKYVLQSDNGTVYDIDHQDQVKKFEGKRVRVHGTLDGKTIHVQ